MCIHAYIYIINAFVKTCIQFLISTPLLFTVVSVSFVLGLLDAFFLWFLKARVSKELK